MLSLYNTRYFNLIGCGRIVAYKIFSEFYESSFVYCEKLNVRYAPFLSERFVNRTELAQGMVELRRQKKNRFDLITEGANCRYEPLQTKLLRTASSGLLDVMM